jgi:uncharacterized repeat protein (TIGR01451 family)
MKIDGMVNKLTESRWRNLKKPALLIAALLITASLFYVSAPHAELDFHGVGLLKTADPSAEVGDTVTYHIRVYNPSDFDLHNINVTDNLLDFNATIPFMAEGNETGVTYTLNRTILDTDPNPLVNTVSVEAVDSEGIRSTASTEAKTTIIERLIDITKTGPDFAHEGDAVKYTITVTNLANVTLFNATVNDQLIGFSWKGDLSVGEADTFNFTYVIPAGAPDPLINTAIAQAKLNQTIILDEATWTIDILHPKIDIDKSVHPNEIRPNQTVTYTIKTTNKGDAELFNITLADSIYGMPPNGTIPSSLMPGESFTWTFNATLTDCTVNVANVTAVDALGMEVHDRDKAVVKVKRICPKSMGYWKNHPAAWPVEEIRIGNVTYTKEEALAILWRANAKDATRMLAAQLIAAKLNRLIGVSASFDYCHKHVNIDDVIADADAFLVKHPLGSDPRCADREKALMLKDILDAYNNQWC